MDPFELLKKDHTTVAKLFERIKSVSGKAKLPVFQRIKSELELHTHIEEAIFYPALEKANETRDLTLEAFEEHKVIKGLLAELDSGQGVSDEWEAKLTVLKENVEHHVDEEENELFKKANDVLTSQEAERLGDRMEAEKIRRGGKPAAAKPAEKPGLLQTIANALGIGGAPSKAIKKTSNKASKKTSEKVSKKQPAKKTSAAKGAQAKASAKGGAWKSAGASASSAKKGTGRQAKVGSGSKSQPKAAKKAAEKTGGGKGSRDTKSTLAKKKPAAKK